MKSVYQFEPINHKNWHTAEKVQKRLFPVESLELKLAHTGVRTRHNQTFGQRYVSNFCSNVAPPRARKLRWYVFLICLLKLPQVSGL